MKNVVLIICILLFNFISFGQNQKDEELAINKQVDAMIYSWNRHDFSDLKNYTTENTDWVNVVGMWWKGRKESQFAHQEYHNGILKASVVAKQSTTIRFLTKVVALAHIYWHFNEFIDPSGKKVEPADCIATVVYVKRNGRWLMEAGSNLTIVKEVQQFDPIRNMPRN